MEELVGILTKVCPDIDFENERNLVDDGVLSSFDMIAIVNELVDAFGVDIGVSDLEADNFNSAQAMWDFIQQQL